MRRRRGFTLIELMVVVTVIGVLAGVAIPQYLKFQSRSRQTEAKLNLRAVYTGQRAWFTEKNGYTTRAGDIGFIPERPNRYAYFLDGAAITLIDRSAQNPPNCATCTGISVDVFRYGPQLAVTALPANPTPGPVATAVGVAGTCPDCHFIAAAAGNIDADLVLDYWSISTETRNHPAYGPSVEGAPLQELDDTE